MTREEAIQILSTRLENIAWLYGSVEREQNLEAIDMAIKALSVANLKEEFESAEYEDYEHATLVDIKEPLKVLVVRCKDCRYAMVRTEEEMNKPIKPQPILCEWFCIGVENDDYCSHGERRK